MVVTCAPRCRGGRGPGEEVLQFGVGVVLLLGGGVDMGGLQQDAAVLVDSHEEPLVGVAGECRAAACVGLDERRLWSHTPRLCPFRIRHR